MKNNWKFKMAAFALLGIVAMGAVVMWLWNWLLPSLFHLPEITYFQSLGLMLLTRILFRGFIGRPNGQCGQWGSFKGNQWKEKWSALSSDEKDKMRDLWKKRCGSFNCSEEEAKKTNDSVN